MSYNVLGTVRKHPEEVPRIVDKRKKVSEKQGTDGDRLSASPSEATTSSSMDFFCVGTEVEMLPKARFESTEEVLQEIQAKYVRSKVHENEEEASDTSLNPLEAPLNLAVSSVHANRDACASTLQAFKFGVSHSRGSRPYMEDRYSIVATLRAAGCGALDDGTFRSFCGIFDGHNGFKAAEYAARRIHQLLSYQPCMVLPDPHPVDVKKALREAFLQTDSEILDRMKREGCRDGTTAVVCMRIGCLLYLGHVGDSRAVLCRQGVAHRLTTDHKPDLPQEKSRVHSVGGRVEFSGCWRVICEPRMDRPGSGLAVTRSLGDLDFKEPIRLVEAMPDVGHLPLQPVDQFVILGSDGLWDVITDQEAVDLVCSTVNDTRQQGRCPVGMNTRSGMAKAASDALVRAALKRGSLDNVTSLVILMEWS